MTDRAKKISELPVLGSAGSVDLLPIVDKHTASTSNTKTITVAAFFGNVSTNAVFQNTVSIGTLQISKNNTPANSSITVERNTIWADSDYIYVAVANNVVKRVALNTF